MAQNPSIAERRLFHAEATVSYVKDTLKIQSSDEFRYAHILRVDRHMKLASQRNAYVDDKVYTLSVDYYRTVANAATQSGLGNCMEKAAIAFTMLFDKGLDYLRPLHYCTSNGGGHAFVVIGQMTGVIGNQPFHHKLMDLNNPITWPKDTVICDPWREVSHVSHKWFLHQNANPQIRQEYSVGG